ncbi:CPBP family glutamic-type intramembrane protease [Campylobacter gastrosuis]|uniref:CPBP family glutamic-type intramembrane protease n=1 Tax=Campylobacter gastrosuis TaxID=2974576 RepID=A0ABT7HS91_9BACT|nr:CPBP family glutamic-type intramembrane protease [Campylobacter gastrosuis]MDL0089786.1 CPBP family glutamic-type intramembrane protease [Campylobacter gastrosuis]
MLKELRFTDIFVLSAIFFGYATYTSTIYFLSGTSDFSSVTDFSQRDNYLGFAIQLCLFGLAFIYLRFIKYGFSVLKFQITLKSTIFSVILFCFLALLMDGYFWLLDVFGVAYPASSYIDTSIIIYSLFNGFYEEFFFIALCLSVNPKIIKGVFIYSLFVRFSFHTYQGVASALGITLILGCIYFLLYERLRVKNLYPYFLSHALADIFGLGILYYIF